MVHFFVVDPRGDVADVDEDGVQDELGRFLEVALLHGS